MELTNEQSPERVQLYEMFEMLNSLERELVITSDVSRNFEVKLSIKEVKYHIKELTEIINKEDTNEIRDIKSCRRKDMSLSPKLNQVLEKLSQETNQSTEEILRKAIPLIKIAIY
ncbi:hypothetical protein [Crocosphaera sp.]|uniref:hypothetical protein n=1 Tax=Crocosphaera sp. TaxID=2729996 RepID=UPI002632CCCA|nr:hypothetical protein [Crocosphaera sp.]MDJ0580527.1 hypothetical protein [Crocosphaera sp.]